MKRPLSPLSSPDSSGPSLTFPSHSTTATTPTTSHRWSELVPPMSALTFAAVWDPTEGMVTFSGAELLDDSSPRPTAKHKCADAPSDALSQVLTVDLFTPTGENTAAARETFADMAAYFAPSAHLLTPGYAYSHRHKPSTTRGGADVYLPPPKTPAQFSCFRPLDGDGPFDPRTVFAHFCPERKARVFERVRAAGGRGEGSVTDEGFFEERPRWEQPVRVHLNLVSHFSTTTTSTSNYVEVPRPSPSPASSCCWSTLEDPGPCVGDCACASPRRLRKRRRPAEPAIACAVAPPAEVLARAEYNYTSTPPAAPPASSEPTAEKKENGLLRLARKLSAPRCAYRDARKGEDEQWVCVEVTEEVEVTRRITQRVV